MHNLIYPLIYLVTKFSVPDLFSFNIFLMSTRESMCPPLGAYIKVLMQ